MMRVYSKLKKERHVRWRKKYNQKHRYGTKETQGKRYTLSEMCLILNKRWSELKGGRLLTDVEIAKLLKRSLQAIQLQRYKIKRERYE
jgi:hypothetical protein